MQGSKMPATSVIVCAIEMHSYIHDITSEYSMLKKTTLDCNESFEMIPSSLLGFQKLALLFMEYIFSTQKKDHNKTVNQSMQ